MLFTEKKKIIKVQLVTFRDGLQSILGGKVMLKDFLPAMECAAHLGVKHFEFGGGARFQAPYFHVGEDPFECMRMIRNKVGPDVNLQILTRSISGVTMKTQSREVLTLQARLMKEYGTTWNRNFDFMYDVELMRETGKPIVAAGMHHQIAVLMMGLPFFSTEVHTPEFYIDVVKRMIQSDIQIDSVCIKDPGGTAAPKDVFETVKGVKKIMPPEMQLWFHIHDTASTAVYCYLAALEGGADGVDLSVRPLASGTAQPDVRSMASALRGTNYVFDFDISGIDEVEALLTEGTRDYDFNPVVLTPDARVLGFPMPGGAIGPNVHMMVKAGIMHRYGEILSEFPEVLEKGGAWVAATPGSQHYWVQAFNNVLFGRWKKIDPGYGRSVLGYNGKTPLPPDPKVVKLASEQLKLQPFKGNPLDAAENDLPLAREELKRRGLPEDDKSVFLVAAAMVPGKSMEQNEGIRLLEGRPKIDLPLKLKNKPNKTERDLKTEAGNPRLSKERESQAVGIQDGPLTTICKVKEDGRVRTVEICLEKIYQP